MSSFRTETFRTTWTWASPTLKGFVLFGSALSMCWATLVSIINLHLSTLILPHPDRILFFELLIQDVTIFFLIGFWHPLPRMREGVNDFAITACRQFIRFWFLLWLGFFALYLVLSLL